jgi:uncharacterized membrane protein
MKLKGKIDHVGHLGGMLVGLIVAEGIKRSDKRYGVERNAPTTGSAASDLIALFKGWWNGSNDRSAKSKSSSDMGIE